MFDQIYGMIFFPLHVLLYILYFTIELYCSSRGKSFEMPCFHFFLYHIHLLTFEQGVCRLLLTAVADLAVHIPVVFDNILLSRDSVTAFLSLQLLFTCWVFFSCHCWFKAQVSNLWPGGQMWPVISF